MSSVTKVLGGVQDLMFGSGAVAQTRSGVPVNIDPIDMMLPVNTKAALKALDVATVLRYYRTVLLLGDTVKGDSGAGIFYHDTTYAQASADDFDSIIDSSAGPLGCWRRVIQSTRKTSSGTTTPTVVAAGAYTWLTGIDHGLDSDDIDVGATLLSSVSKAAASTSELFIVTASGYIYSGMSPVGVLVIPATLPAAGQLRIGIANNHGTDQELTVRWWARKRS